MIVAAARDMPREGWWEAGFGIACMANHENNEDLRKVPTKLTDVA